MESGYGVGLAQLTALEGEPAIAEGYAADAARAGELIQQTAYAASRQPFLEVVQSDRAVGKHGVDPVLQDLSRHGFTGALPHALFPARGSAALADVGIRPRRPLQAEAFFQLDHKAACPQILILSKIDPPVHADPRSGYVDMLSLRVIVQHHGIRLLGRIKTHLFHEDFRDAAPCKRREALSLRQAQGLMPDRFGDIRALLGGGAQFAGYVSGRRAADRPPDGHARLLSVLGVAPQEAGHQAEKASSSADAPHALHLSSPSRSPVSLAPTRLARKRDSSARMSAIRRSSCAAMPERLRWWAI